MGRGRDWRPPRRRGFDDDDFSFAAPRGVARPSFSAPRPRDERPAGPPTKAVVKWFNAEKGFGFVEPSDGSGDAFLHISALERAGHSAVSPGATLEVQLSQGQKGPQVAAVLDVDASMASAGPSRESSRSGPRAPRQEPASGDTVEMLGAVKWFNAEKGFGFIAPSDGSKDVFVHVTVLRRSNLSTLDDGQAVRMRVGPGRKGPEAVSISLA